MPTTESTPRIPFELTRAKAESCGGVASATNAHVESHDEGDPAVSRKPPATFVQSLFALQPG
jgi:hypothetical protein